MSTTWINVIDAVSADVRATSSARNVQRVVAQYQSAIRTYAGWMECPLDADVSAYLDCGLDELLAEVDEVTAQQSPDTRYVYRSRMRRAWQVARRLFDAERNWECLQAND